MDQLPGVVLMLIPESVPLFWRVSVGDVQERDVVMSLLGVLDSVECEIHDWVPMGEERTAAVAHGHFLRLALPLVDPSNLALLRQREAHPLVEGASQTAPRQL